MNNKKHLLISSLLILLPIPVGMVLWNTLEAPSALYWGQTRFPYELFFMPVIMLAVQWLCIYFTRKDPGNQGRNEKPLALVLWIVPVTSNLMTYMMFALALGVKFSPVAGTMLSLGLMFAAIGNYLPKCRMNSTMGIKVPWAYTSEANWNATHRFGGKVWVIGGLLMAFGGLLPDNAAITVMLVAILVLILAPTIYSYRFYRRQKANGEALVPFSKLVTGNGKATTVFLLALLIFVGGILFTGDIELDFGPEAVSINASYYGDMTVGYDAIDSVEFREGNVPGTRVGGFGSFRLLMGFFQNEEFGTYTRYTYYKPEACVVLTSKGKTLVLSGETYTQSETIYRTLLEKTGK